jgi:hypothetical protein
MIIVYIPLLLWLLFLELQLPVNNSNQLAAAAAVIVIYNLSKPMKIPSKSYYISENYKL